VLLALARGAEAIPLLQQALGLWRGVAGGNPLGVENLLRELAPALAAAGRAAEAVERYRELLSLRIELGGAGALSVADVRLRIGRILAGTGEPTAAEEEMRAALGIARAARSAPAVASIAYELGVLLAEGDRRDEAASLFAETRDALAPGQPLRERAERALAALPAERSAPAATGR
jgi:hypothetical protein